jgi:pyruvate kinase
MPLERVPRIQKEIVGLCRSLGLPVIVATQVLESMRTEPRPTRAEVSDAATAVDEGADAIMLAGETAAGSFPARTVQTLDAIIREAEATPARERPQTAFRPLNAGPTHALCAAAVTLADTGEVEAIVAVTRGGSTARLLSALRPAATIFATTAREDTARRLALYWGVVPVILSDIGDNVDTAGLRATQALLRSGAVTAGGVVVLVSVNPDLSRADANFLKLQRIEPIAGS